MLATTIKRLRKAKRFSQDKLARLSDIPYNTLIKIESGRSNNPTFETLVKIADALEVSLGELADRDKLTFTKNNVRSSFRRET